MRRILRRILPVAGTAALAACALVDTGPAGYDTPSTVIYYRDTTSIVAPDTASRGVPFEVTFTTFGGGCTSAGGTAVELSATAAVLRGQDHQSGYPDCTRILRVITHRAEVRFDASGPARLRIVGLDESQRAVEFVRDVNVR